MQGLHHVAQNEIIMGLPLLERVAVLTGMPFRSLSGTAGSVAAAYRAMQHRAVMVKNRFIYFKTTKTGAKVTLFFGICKFRGEKIRKKSGLTYEKAGGIVKNQGR